MEMYGKRTLYSFIDEEKRELKSPTHPQFSPARTSSTTTSNTMMSLLPPPSPGSPWTLSPHQTPSPSLLYHCIASLHRQEGNIYSIALSKGLVFTGSESNRIRAWRQPDCIERCCIKASCGEIRAILAYGNMLFTTHKDHKIQMWNFGVSENFRSKKVATLPKRSSSFHLFSNSNTQYHHHQQQQQHKDCVSCMAYYHAEGLLYTGSWDKTVKAWRISDNKQSCVDSFLAHEDRVNALVVNQENGCVFTCSSDGCVKIWRRVYGESSHTLTMTLQLFQSSPVNALALSSSYNNSNKSCCFLYSGSSDGFINFWDKETMSGRFNHGGFLQGHRFAILSLVAIEKLIFSGSEDTMIRVWRREEDSCFHECLAVLDGHRGPVKCLAACLEMDKIVIKGFLVYSSSLDQTFKVWRVKVLPEENKLVYDLTYSERPRRSDSKTKNMRNDSHEISPVLSPSWVERKVHGNHFFH